MTVFRILALLGIILITLAGVSPVQATGTWTSLKNSAPVGIETMLLLPDGTVMGLYYQAGNDWYKLTPDSHGSYINGTWSPMSSMNHGRLYFGSTILANGQVFVAGGEYVDSAHGETYDPIRNLWTEVPGQVNGLADQAVETLPNGNVLCAAPYAGSAGTPIFNVASNTWTTGIQPVGGTSEACFVKLPDGSILCPGSTTSMRFIPALNQWVADGNIPVPLFSGGETGSAYLLPNGNVFAIGYGNTAIYTPSGNSSPGTWVAGPPIPNGLNSGDSPAAMMVNGKILLVADTGYTSGASSFFEYDYTTNAFTPVSAPFGSPGPAFICSMLNLPDGNILFSAIWGTPWVYTPDGSPLAVGQPTISSVVQNTDGTFTLTGTLLNGITEGAGFGDDLTCATNYPIVRLTGTDGSVYYARTFNWSSTGVDSGANPSPATKTTQFALPLGLPAGTYSLVVTANGNPSSPVSLTIPGGTDTAPTVATAASAVQSTTTPSTATLSVLGASANGESTLTYTWTVTGPGWTLLPSLSVNGSNAAKNCTATFDQAGTYHFTVTITDALGLSTTSTTNITVTQVLTSIQVTPAVANLTSGQTQQFTGHGYDQFGSNMSAQPTFTWALTSGGGTLSASGLYTSPGSGTAASLTATTGTLQASAGAYVVSAPWVSADVGSVNATGSAYDSAGVFTVNSQTNDIWGTADSFHYVYRTMGGDGMMLARVSAQENTNAWAKAGVMIRNSTAAGDVYAMMSLTPGNGANFQYRNALNGSSSNATTSGPVAPYWVKLVRRGSTFTGYYSANGSTWTQQGSVTLAMGANVLVGLAADSMNTGEMNTTTFDNVSMLLAQNDSMAVNLASSGTINLLSRDVTGPAGATLTISSVTQGAYGTVVNNGDGTVTYNAGGGYARNDTFTYTVGDGLGDTATATVTVTISGMSAYLKFDDGAGSVAADSTGNGFTGVLQNSPTWTAGELNGALAFNGTNQFVSVSDSSVSETSYAISLWFKTTSANGGLFEVNNSPTNPNAYDRDLWLSGGNLNAYVYANAPTLTTTGLNLADGNWHHVVHTFGSAVGGQQLYVDGVLRASGSKSYSDFNWETNFNIGYSKMSSSAYFNGSIDEVRLYNVALNASAVSALYNQTAPTVASPATASSNPVNGPRTNLSVLGASANGEGTLFYTWAATSIPSGANLPIFSNNGNNAAKNTTVDFSTAGTYTFTATITDSNGFSTTSSVTVSVSQVQLVWSGGGGNSNWSNSANWTGGWVPNAGDQLVVSGSTNNDLVAGTAFNSIILQGNSVSISGNALALNPGSNVGITSSGTNNSIAVPIQINSNATISVSTGSLLMTGAVSGTGSLTKTGAGTLTLSGANTYTGTTTAAAGILNVTGSISATSQVVIGSSGSVGATLQIALPGNVNLASLTTASGATGSIFTLNPSGNNFLNVTGATTLNSPLTVGKTSSGSWCGFLPAGITGNGGGAGNDTLIFTNAGGAQFYPQGGSGAYNYSGNVHFLTANGSDYRLQGVNMFPATASVTLDSGAVVRDNSNGTNFTFDALNGAGTWDTFNNTTSTLTIGANGGTGSFSGPITNSGGTTSVVKAGAGTETLSGSSSYTGPTTISGGTLSVTGSIATSAVTVSSGVLAGTGTVGTVAVSTGGTLAPGVGSTGTMSFNSKALSLAGTAAMDINKSAGTSDKAQGIAALTYGGALTVNNIAGTLAAGDVFTLFSATSYSGSFATLYLPALAPGLYWNTSNLTTNGTISIVGQTLTSVVVTPSTASLGSHGTQQFTATANDQFNNPMVPQPSLTWSNSGPGSVNATGLYTGSYASSSDTVQAATGSMSGTASITVTNAAPTVATAAGASPGIVNGTSTSLSVLGADNDGGGESNLTYSWTATVVPSGGAASFSPNLNNAAKNSTATFSQPGAYTLTVTITDGGGLSTTSSVNVTVNQTVAAISVSPGSVTVSSGGTQQFTASAVDQFGTVMSPSITWSNTGSGTANSSGLYTGSYASGTATVTATSGSVTGSASVTITNAAPTVATAASASPSTVTGTTTSLSVLGADSDGGGEPNLTYTWAATAMPSGAVTPTYSANGTNAAKNTTVTISTLGNYTFTVTITDLGGLSTTSSVNVLATNTPSGVWTNTAGGSWTNAANWSGGIIATGVGATADFSTLNLTADATVTLDGARTIGNLAFGDITPSNNWILSTGSGGPLTLSVTSGTPTVTVNNQTTTINAVVAGNQGFGKSGLGTLTLGGNNTYTGAITVSQGTLDANQVNALGAATNTMVLGDGNTGSNSVELKMDSGVTATASLSSISTSNYGSTQTITINSGSGLASNVAALTATLNLNGSVPLTIRGTNTAGHATAQDINCRWQGTAIPAGTTALILDGTSATIRTSQLSNTSAASSFTGDVLIKGTVSTQGRTYLAQTAANQNLNFLNNDITINSGSTWTIVWGGETAGALNGPGNVNLNNQNALNGIGLTFGNTNRNGTHSGIISGGFGIAKVGTGTQTLSGASTYTGATTVNGGTLSVTGSIASAVTVNSGGTLGGTGTTRAVTVASGGTLAPGVSGIGTLTVSGTLGLSGTVTMEINKSTATSDLVKGITTLTYGGTLNVTNLAGTLAAGDTFTLFTATSYSGNFATINLPTLGTGLYWNTANLTANGTISVAGGSLPSGWSNSDIGSVGVAGWSTYSSGVYTVSGSGTDIGGAADAFQFSSETLTGDGEIRARVTSQSNSNASAKAGVMVRDGTAAGAVNALVALTPGHGFQFQSRSAVNGATTSGGTSASNAAPNNWVRLTRSGTLVAAYVSADGNTWTEVGTALLSMSSSVSVGLAVTSDNNSVSGTATFDNVSITQFPSPWQTSDIGSTGLLGSAEYFNGAFTVKGAGTIGSTSDNFRFVYQSLSGDGQVVSRISNPQNTGTSALLGVMIRDTLDTSAMYAFVGVNGAGTYEWQDRASTGGNSSTISSGSGTAPNIWVKLVRSSDTLSAYQSSDGSTWTLITSATISMGTNIYIGLADASGSTTTLNSSIFDNVSVVP